MVMFGGHSCVVAALILVFFPGKSVQSGLGKCPRIPYMENFNLTRFAGRWYEIERSFYLIQTISNCVTFNLREKSNIQLEVDVTTRSRWSDSFTVSEGLATQKRRHPSLFTYKVESKMPRIISRYLPGAGVYQIIDTDYDNYAVLWSCTNYDVIHTDLIWIWARQREIDATIRAGIYDMLDAIELDSERLILPKDRNCTL